MIPRAQTPDQPHAPQASLPATVLFLRYWLPVLLWCLVIFSASSDSQSTRRTSRFIGPLVRWLVPGATDETVARVQWVVRKTAHVTEYAFLALLLWRACRRPVRADTRPWRWRDAFVALVGAMLIAIGDEVNQAFVPNRQGHPLDVFLDTCGAAMALLAIRSWGRRKKRW